MAKKEKKKLPVFYKILFTCVILALILILVGMVILYGILANYEKSQPKNVADKVFAEYYESGNYEKLAAKCAEGSPFESADDIAAYLNENYKGVEFTCTAGLEQNGKPTYIVKMGDKKISYFTLKEKNENSDFKSYEPDTFVVFGNYGTVTIDAPEGYVPYINGTEVPASLITKSDIPDEGDRFLPEGVTGPKHSVYTISGLMGKPELSAKAPDGQDASITEDSTGMNYSVALVSDKELEAEMGEYALKVAQEYSKFMESDSYWGAISGYFDPDSEVYENVATSLNMFVWDHDGYRFDDVKVGSFYRYNENVFSARIAFTHVLVLGAQEFKDYFDTTLIFRNVGGEYKVCGMINHS